MSSHVHLGVLAGPHSLSRLIAKTHSSKVSRWMKSALSVHDELEPLVDKVEKALARQRVQKSKDRAKAGCDTAWK
jgi:hypothetical protein